MDDHQINYIKKNVKKITCFLSMISPLWLHKKHSWKTVVTKFEIYKLMLDNSHIVVRTNGFGFLVELEELTWSFKIKEKVVWEQAKVFEIHIF
jgi:hypothetical protein